jgi:hypothetical protein
MNSFEYLSLNLFKKSGLGISLKLKQKSVSSWMDSMRYSSSVLYWYFFQKFFRDSAYLSGIKPYV